ncbi:SDR family NAD(P)-dependent oxidoreductase [Tundrisphaera lichenicola]|uniref:SDR family NAD(P)-dependent oxidoreductase n=1 Tax=Tundrisphaera lichenicola TaxID=2029860 RepID=UPI003EBB955D
MSRRKSFSGARCLVTGASSGLGRAIAEELVKAGSNVLLTGRSIDRLDQVATHLVASGASPDAVTRIAADLTLERGREEVLRLARDRFGALDIVVNAAGVGATGHFDTHEPEIFRSIFEINVFALVEMTRMSLPLLRRGVRPSLVNLGSIVARRALPGRPEYSSSKFAVAGFTESIRAEWSKYGIHVLLLNPGFTKTEFEQNLLVNTARVPTSQKRVMTAKKVAEHTLKAIRRGHHELTLTTEGQLLLFINRLAPRIVDAGFAFFTRRVFRDVVRSSWEVSREE